MALVRIRLETWARAAGLLATAWLVWTTSVGPSWMHGHLPLLLVRVWWMASCALGWSIGLAVAVRAVNRHLGCTESEGDLRTSSVAIWYAPATLLLVQHSIVPVTSGMVLLVIATRLLCAPWRPSGSGIGSRQFLPALAVAVSLESAAVSLVMARRMQAVGLFELSVAILVTVALGIGLWAGRRTPNLPRGVLGLLVTVMLAMMTQRLPGGRGWGSSWSGPGDGDSDSSISAASPAARQASPASDLPDLSKSSDYGPEYHVPGGFPGVIMWPEIKPVPVLVAPLLHDGPGYAGTANPLAIPFGGEYWMYRFPLRRPPRNSFFKRGSPVNSSFSTTDFTALTMEARQKLEQPISTGCCRSILVEIRNADPGPNRLELFVMNGAQSQTLGSFDVRSRGSISQPVLDTVEFPFWPAARLEEFDQLGVVFHRRPGLASSHSARIALERFVLEP